MPGTEFLDRILRHERDFRRVAIQPPMPIDSDEYSAVTEFLQDAPETERDHGLDFRDAELEHLHAINWTFRNARFANADLTHAVLEQSTFYYATFDYARLLNVRIRGASFERCHFVETLIRNTDLALTSFRTCIFHRSEIWNCRGIRRASGINSSTFTDSVVDLHGYLELHSVFGQKDGDNRYELAINLLDGRCTYSTSDTPFTHDLPKRF